MAMSNEVLACLKLSLSSIKMRIKLGLGPNQIYVSDILQFIGITALFATIFLVSRMEWWNSGILPQNRSL